MKNTLKLLAKGGVIGIANIIPGVSGGTMAVVMGIYEPLIEAIGNFFTNSERRKSYFIFLLKVLSGAGIAIIVLSWVMDYLLIHYESYTYLFFIGLIAGSIPSIYRTHPEMKINLISLVTFLAGVALILGMFFSFPENLQAKNPVEVNINPSSAFMLFISGIFSGGSMIMPGVSGSFILVLLGQYHIVIRAVKHFNLVPLFFLGIGIAIGIWGFAKMIDYFLKRFPKETMYFILGLLFASLIPIFPGLPSGFIPVLLSIFVVLAGGWISYRLGMREREDEVRR